MKLKNIEVDAPSTRVSDSKVLPLQHEKRSEGESFNHPDFFLKRSESSSTHALASASISLDRPRRNNKLKRPINQQSGEYRLSLLQFSKLSFKEHVPYVVGTELPSKEKVYFNLVELYRDHFQFVKDDEDLAPRIQQWVERLSSLHFYCFLDANSVPLDLGTLASLESRGISGINFLGPLLTPLCNPEQARVLYLVLGLSKVLPTEVTRYAEKALSKTEKDEIDEVKENLLVSAASLPSSALLRLLLGLSISPDSLDLRSGHYAINAARQNQRTENEEILLKWGADPDLQPESNPY